MPHESIQKLATNLFNDKYSENRVFFNSKKIHQFGKDFLELLYPQLSNRSYKSEHEIENQLHYLQVLLCEILTNIELKREDYTLEKRKICSSFMKKMHQLEAKINLDAQAMFDGDPAALSVDEVITCYPGFRAIAIYRIAHEFYLMKIPIFPRILSEYAHQLTGVDIHPGAEIGNSFFIDHGTGVVIGETTKIGKNVKVYQGVTLGALSVEKKFANAKRHPTIKDGAVIYSNATILGGETVIGQNTIVGGNTWVTKSVEDNMIIYNSSKSKLLKNE